MKFNVEVKNLGPLKQGSFNVRPITVLTGPNGTGKSFFSKALYSVLSVFNRNTYEIEIRHLLEKLQQILGYLEVDQPLNDEQTELLAKMSDMIAQMLSELVLSAEVSFEQTLKFVDTIPVKVQTLQSYYQQLDPEQQFVQAAVFARYCYALTDENMKTIGPAHRLWDELKQNFQVLKVRELANSEQRCQFAIDDLFSFSFSFAVEGSRSNCTIDTSFASKISQLSNVVFFESPVYWKMRDALYAARDGVRDRLVHGQKSSDILQGVPKYFYDLDQALRTRIAQPEQNDFQAISDGLKQQLGGEFKFNNGDLSFKSHDGKQIASQLMSLGMTNLGMLHVLLANNVITKGSFVFIDEPETNLHPDWQVFLMDMLIELAKAGVNVVMASHSTDMLKALEVGIKRRQSSTDDQVNDDFMSIHYFDTDGTLLDFDAQEPLSQLIEARDCLSASYQNLYFEGVSITGDGNG